MKRVLIAGASGFIGTELTKFLETQNCTVLKLVRSEPKSEKEIFWNPQQQVLNATDLEGFDVFINLAGENIAAGRWTKARKRKILESRILTTSLLTKVINQLSTPPRLLISASAIGIYQKTQAEISLTESSPTDSDFLAEVCKAWEATATTINQSKTKVALLRIAPVISLKGGMLGKLLPVFRLGLGATLGNGKQNFSWIGLNDLCRAVLFIIDQQLSGPINLSSPESINNLNFSKQFAHFLKRPCLFSIPKLVLYLIFGKEFSDQTLLSSQNVAPKKLLDSGFNFKTSKFSQALDASIN
jgi:uncharacterized protein (TIGR01777 family)